MSITCDFCERNALKYKNVYFIANDSGAIHICEDCAKSVILSAKEEREEKNSKNNKEFKQALEKTQEKHADVINQLARHD
ncbi:TPA: hypothetical protein ACS78B_001953 [Providencia alcalifaciens]|uniref:hypothetical protein n=1 Tax=Providencia alcalifaciens TaxID=126385 RepID=UPI001CC609C2|nr:hypothetical protein [Providencia alcalifaciens]CAG9418787.1 hypothetical protein NVI2019_NGLDDFDA_01671 [Providencia alcalifaciens]